MKEFAAVEWDRAGRALESARQLVDTDPDSAASRAYYAAFHALTAMFALHGQTFTKHSSSSPSSRFGPAGAFEQGIWQGL